jgi:hypothetical protein
MGIYKLKRHVVPKPGGCQETVEAWGIDRVPIGLETRVAPRDTDADDPLRCRDACCVNLLRLSDGGLVTWGRIAEWMSEAEDAGYTVISGYKNLSPYSVILIRGP